MLHTVCQVLSKTLRHYEQQIIVHHLTICFHIYFTQFLPTVFDFKLEMDSELASSIAVIRTILSVDNVDLEYVVFKRS